MGCWNEQFVIDQMPDDANQLIGGNNRQLPDA